MEELIPNNYTQELIEYSIENNPFKICCEVGFVNNIYAGVAFQCVYKDGKIINATFRETEWGFEALYEGEDRSKFETLLDNLSSEFTVKYNKSWEEKPIIDETLMEEPHEL